MIKIDFHFKLKNKRPTWCHLLFYFTSYELNMFRTLIYPSSGACDYAVELPHLSFCSCFAMCWRFGVAGLGWYPCCRLKPATRMLLVILLTQERIFDSRAFLVGFVMNEVAVWQSFLWVYISFTVVSIPPIFRTL